MTLLTRRSALLGIGAALCAPAVVRAESLMRVAKLILPEPYQLITRLDVLYGSMYISEELTAEWNARWTVVREWNAAMILARKMDFKFISGTNWK